MTETEIRNVDEFKNLPILPEDQSEVLLRPLDPNYTGEIFEAEDEDEFWEYTRNDGLEPRGMIRYSPDDVRAVFWALRSNS